MKRVLLDGTSCQGEREGHYHGAAEYGKEILAEAIAKGYDFDIVLYNHYYTYPDLQELLKKIPEDKIHYVDDKQQIYSLIEQLNIERFFSTLPYAFYDYQGSAQFIAVIHGLRKLELPWDDEAWRLEKHFHKRFIAKHFPKLKAKNIQHEKTKEFEKLLTIPDLKLITSSDHTKYALLNYFPHLRPQDIKVFYSHISINGFQPSGHVGDSYLLLNANRYEKNAFRAVKVFDRLFTEGRLKGKRVIVTGCQKINMRRVVKNKERFMFMGTVPYEELRKYYSEAFCLVFPSLNEGFAYPPLKAMACDVPVIASTATSIPEVCAGAALYFSPTNCDDLANRILQIDINDELRSWLIYEGHKRLEQLVQRQAKEIQQELRFIFGIERPESMSPKSDGDTTTETDSESDTEIVSESNTETNTESDAKTSTKNSTEASPETTSKVNPETPIKGSPETTLKKHSKKHAK